MPLPLLLRIFAVLGITFLAEPRALPQDPAAPKPTQANVHYGPHERQVLDFYQARPDQITPILFYIHGGGWMMGDKSSPDFLPAMLKAGISVVSINYRFIDDAIAAQIQPPVKACLDDAARALQFVRSKSAEWRLDKTRIAGCGGSAGGFSTLWLAFHPDLANPRSPDPIARESTRLTCTLTFVPQTSLDPQQMRAWIPNIEYGNHAFGLPSYQAFLDQREALLPLIAEYSPYLLATADDPPTYLFYDTAPTMGQPAKDPPHSANFGAGLVEKLKSVGIEYELNVPGATDLKHPDLLNFFREKLKVPAQ